MDARVEACRIGGGLNEGPCQNCGDLEHGFARNRCDHCKIDHLLAFSCKGRWFCPSCHQKKVQFFGALLAEAILYPVPHRHYMLSIPKLLRPYFRYNLKTDLGESTDLSAQHPEKTKRLAASLGKHLRAVDAVMPILKSTGQSVPYPGTNGQSNRSVP